MFRSLAALILLFVGALVLYRYVPTHEEVFQPPAEKLIWQQKSPNKTVTTLDEKLPRPVAPEQFAQPFAEDVAALERIAPRAPLTPPPVEDTSPRPTLLHRPLVTAAGLITYPQGELQLKGLQIVGPDETCTGPDGSSWPCGIIARTAFRNFLRGRALSCVVPGGDWTETVVVACLVGKQDPAAWLASRGWARASEDGQYAELERAAKEAGKGVYGSDPRRPLPVLDSKVEIAPEEVSPVSDLQPEPSQ